MNESNYKYPVAVEPLFLAGERQTELLATVRTDTREALGVVSSRYGVIQNEDVTNAVDASIKAIGLEATSFSPIVTLGGARFYARYDFRSKTAKIPEVGDLCGLRITAKNSFDGSGATVLQLGVLVLTCKNGATRSNSEWAVSQTHCGKGDLLAGVRHGLQDLIGSFDSVVESFGKLVQAGVNTDHGVNIIKHLVEKDVVPSRVASRIEQIWRFPDFAKDKPRNLWSLYNAGTQVLSHEIEDQKFEIATRINAKLSRSLFELAGDSTRLGQLALAS